MTYSAENEVMQKKLKFEDTKTIVRIDNLQADNLIMFLKEELKEGGCAAVLLNTVRQVQETAHLLRQCFPDEQILELHSRYIYPDRKEREDELIRRMGKKSTAKERNGFILVASQAAEQSLDFDADILITELCPADFLLQRMGREHRHKEHDSMRPSNLSKPRCMILRDGEEVYSKGSKAVYAEYLLMRTQAVLPRQICIPDDIPTIVQKVYAEEDFFFQNISGYGQAKKRYEMEQGKKRARAEGFLLQKPKTDDYEEESSLDLFLQEATKVNDKVAEASVRDGGSSLELLVLQSRSGKISFLPWQDEKEVLDGRSPTAVGLYENCKQRIRLPRSLCREDNISGVIEELENLFQKNFIEWKKSSWINGELILLLDENFSATLGGVQLRYSKEDGLIEESVEQEDTNGR